MDYFTLNNGIKMPMAGIGVFMMSPAEAESAVESALKSGVRLIDTANGYMNESGTGRGIKKSGVAREDIFLVTKLWPTVYEKDTAVDETLIEQPIFGELGKKYGKTNAQIILRWHVQSGNVVIPGSKNPDHIRDNFDIFDFTLTDEDMAEIAKVDKGVRYYTATPEMIAAYQTMELKEDL